VLEKILIIIGICFSKLHCCVGRRLKNNAVSPQLIKGVKMKYFTVILTLFVFVIFGCKDDTTSPDDTNQNKNVYPLKVGNQWIYSVGDTITIYKTETLNGKLSYCIDGDDDYTFGERNLYYEGTIVYGWEGTDTVAVQIFDESILESLPKEQVLTPAGTFDTYKYSWGNLTTKIYWFAKGVGVVRAELNGNVRELVKYTLK